MNSAVRTDGTGGLLQARRTLHFSNIEYLYVEKVLSYLLNIQKIQDVSIIARVYEFWKRSLPFEIFYI